jgi:hypothetical protein
MSHRPINRKIRSPIPKPKEFDVARYREIIGQLHERMPGKELEDQCTGIARDILTNYEGFERVEKGPDLWGTPFDFFGFKNGAPYMIELKASLNSFNSPGETQKWRMQELLGWVEGLNIALLQLKLREAKYRIFYDEEMENLFKGEKSPLDPIEEWIRGRLG